MVRDESDLNLLLQTILSLSAGNVGAVTRIFCLKEKRRKKKWRTKKKSKEGKKNVEDKIRKAKKKEKKEKKKRRNGVWIEKGRHTFWVNKERQKRPNEVKIFGRLFLSRVALIFGVSSVSRCGPACDGLAWAGQIVSLRTSVSPNMQILREMEMWGGEGEGGWGRRGGGGGGG